MRCAAWSVPPAWGTLQAPQAFQRLNACSAEVFVSTVTLRAKHPGKVFWFFFSKKNFFFIA
jgi:hypothetical protein